MDPLAFGTLATPVGTVGVLTTEAGVARVGWSLVSPGRLAGPAEDPILREALKQLRAYFAGRLHTFDVPLDLTGATGSRLGVLVYLRDRVPYGRTVSYGELAAQALPGADVPARAIGSIMGSNRHPLLVPCHRVVAAGGLGGYSGGEPGRELETKRWLMQHEGSLTGPLF